MKSRQIGLSDPGVFGLAFLYRLMALDESLAIQ